MQVGLDISKEDFDDTKQLDCKKKIASAARVDKDKVQITKIEEFTFRTRHLLATSIKIDVEVAANDANDASSMANNLNEQNMNLHMPEAQILVSAKVIQSPAAAAASAVTTSGAATTAGSVGLAALAALCARQASGV